MRVDVQFSKNGPSEKTYLTWRPTEATLRLVDAEEDVEVTLTGRSLVGGGALQFSAGLAHDGAESLDVLLTADGAGTTVWVGGSFPRSSSRYGDVVLEVRNSSTNALLASEPVMVRVRKNANLLSQAERDRFLAALATMNGGGGRYADFRDMHVEDAPDYEAHGGSGFLPWHRAYLLDFERELQTIDPEVSLPYWRFDEAAPNVFTRAFMGVGMNNGRVEFSAGNPLVGWIAVGTAGVERGPGVGPQSRPRVLSEQETLSLWPNAVTRFLGFAAMEGNPHGSAHMSHLSGWITNPATAPRDPIFFLLHCNVDRLWAKWQWVHQFQDPSDPHAFGNRPGEQAYSREDPNRAGHRIGDALWPWCGPLQAPRPLTAPGGGLAASPMTAYPGASPVIRDMIDYLGTTSPAHHGVAYDDVPFQI